MDKARLEAALRKAAINRKKEEEALRREVPKYKHHNKRKQFNYHSFFGRG